jgi:hypothetical protein
MSRVGFSSRAVRPTARAVEIPRAYPCRGRKRLLDSDMDPCHGGGSSRASRIRCTSTQPRGAGIPRDAASPARDADPAHDRRPDERALTAGGTSRAATVSRRLAAHEPSTDGREPTRFWTRPRPKDASRQDPASARTRRGPPTSHARDAPARRQGSGREPGARREPPRSHAHAASAAARFRERPQRPRASRTRRESPGPQARVGPSNTRVSERARRRVPAHGLPASPVHESPESRGETRGPPPDSPASSSRMTDARQRMASSLGGSRDSPCSRGRLGGQVPWLRLSAIRTGSPRLLAGSHARPTHVSHCRRSRISRPVVSALESPQRPA